MDGPARLVDSNDLSTALANLLGPEFDRLAVHGVPLTTTV